MFGGMVGSVGAGKARVDTATDSISLGEDAGTLFNADDDDNIAIGGRALNSTGSDARRNIAIGTDALTSLTTGDNCIGIGYQAGLYNTTGISNIAIGFSALKTSVDADSNIAIGSYALEEYEGGDAEGFNTALGLSAGRYVSSGHSNTLIGYQAGIGVDGSEITHDYNTCVGYQAGKALITNGSANTFLGTLAGNAVTTGDYNICIGYDSDTLASNSYSVAIGTSVTTQNKGEIRIGYCGGWQAYSEVEVCTLASADDNDAASTGSVFKIPAYSIIKSVSAVVTQLSDLGTYKLALFISDDVTRSDDQALTNGIEVLGAGVANTRSSAVAFSGTSMDIDAGNGGILNQSYYSEPDIVFDSAAGASNDRYLWVVNAGTGNGDTDPSTNAYLRISVEFAGQD